MLKPFNFKSVRECVSFIFWRVKIVLDSKRLEVNDENTYKEILELVQLMIKNRNTFKKDNPHINYFSTNSTHNNFIVQKLYIYERTAKIQLGLQNN